MIVKQFPTVDLFAGPGGLGEGFSSFNNGGSFKIVVSAEMDSSAHQTLRLRAFYRILKRQGGSALNDYYRFCNGESISPYTRESQKAWLEAGVEAQQLTLGNTEDNLKLFNIIESAGLGESKPWVLIGGPPCQAYSLIGRSRNLGKLNYKAADDHRHYLYLEYLNIIQKFKPAIFVMENVKGILSSKVDGKRIFHSILRDLSDPNQALNKVAGSGYRIHSLCLPTVYERGMSPDDINVHDFIIKSEDYGIPQARHRVILLGVREDLAVPQPLTLKKSNHIANVIDVISDLPKLRSRLSKEVDSSESWSQTIEHHINELYKEAITRNDLQDFALFIKSLSGNILSEASCGGLRVKISANSRLDHTLNDDWYRDKKLNCWLNHETRGHMSSDLRRYLYAASYALIYKTSPKGHEQFDLQGLRPNHDNWETGKFSDRFRVQLLNRPSTTITSHIAKDGHYYIHPDPEQCRSFTVREAARLQTFPDNYFFQGNRTQQFHQVGNAVPPLLAKMIAELVDNILTN